MTKITEKEMYADIETRVTACKKEIEDILTKYEFGLVAEDSIGKYTKIKIDTRFINLKQYDLDIAQAENEFVNEEALSGEGDPINPGAEVVDASEIKE